MPALKPIRVEVALLGVVPNVAGVKSNPTFVLCPPIHVPFTAKQPAAMLNPFALVVVPTSVSAPMVDDPNRPALAKKLVVDAVVAKNAVAVALPKMTGCVSWYATDVVECARPTELKKSAEVVLNAAPWLFARKLDAEVVEKKKPLL